MEFENEEFSVIVPEYLLNEDQIEDQENEDQIEDQENEDQIEDQENEEQIEDQENEDQIEEQNIDYSSILQEMNSRLENIEANTVDYTEAINGLLANVYFIDFVAFTVFVFILLGVVIKFFKQFF